MDILFWLMLPLKGLAALALMIMGFYVIVVGVLLICWVYDRFNNKGKDDEV